MAAVLWKVFLWVRTIPLNSIHVYLFETRKTQLSSDWTAFPDGSRCTDKKPALFPFQNSQKHNARCPIATGKRLMDVGIAVLKRVELNRDGGD